MSQITSSVRRIAVALAASIMIAACDPAVNGVRVEMGTMPLRPVFVLTDSGGRGRSGMIYGVSVVHCGSDTAIWQLTANGSRGAPDRLVYGETPEGYVTVAGPQPLRAGCYDVYITDGRRTRFRVDTQGRVVSEGRRDTTAASPRP